MPGAKGEDHPSLFDALQDRRGCFAVLRFIGLDLLQDFVQMIDVFTCVSHFYSISPAIIQARSSVISSEAPLGMGDMILS